MKPWKKSWRKQLTVDSQRRFTYGVDGEDHLRMVQREDGRPWHGIEPWDLPKVFRPHAGAAILLHGGKRAAKASGHADSPWRRPSVLSARPSTTAFSQFILNCFATSRRQEMKHGPGCFDLLASMQRRKGTAGI
jgi:hypothetical protein